MDSSVTEPEGKTKNTGTFLDQVGGLGGLVSSTLPILIFVPINNKWGLNSGLLAAISIAIAITVWRLMRKENLQPAVSGFIGVGICAAIAWWTGDAKGYFLYGIWMSGLMSLVFIISLIVRWPMVGIIWKGINGEGMTWRGNIAARRAYAVATFGWALLFATRFVVQRNLYEADATNALALARILMGWPLTGLVTLLTVWMVKKAARAMNAEQNMPGEEAVDREDSPVDPGEGHK
ncbi:DUF3159 domain-containing protein [Corynebacterium pseudotuberculosis]|uniref:DUF3159 domain-containing protein n=1 Tax=Corynebacterium pseudotuberculosis (strain C231) TaxID=681645 RepID=D9QAU7_CORP2|nr:DUF3159 domain-containing protein [Corynebacterium pseudotuberculosis]ADK28995.1 DUF3159 domain-containing protein [Corynebacterium pseudotuberculosis FRC41]ADL10673.1 DUF3159 domain-containing protein [Corynebacterium pseudotuberculosis C231]ADL21082.1 DUF3159 domain-containing protein [Corynebacterium pseudotuberculosis 1002]ADO26472.1 DUF3159 domain-containing protein [Corynebacterium pseudotuberculosis I19]AEK92537.1 Hypothetical protein CpPAT10_1196 [Corynebacterium pseudotuberculosis 